jgi:hypothetical protein
MVTTTLMTGTFNKSGLGLPPSWSHQAELIRSGGWPTVPDALGQIIAMTHALLQERSNLQNQEWEALVRSKMPQLYVLDSEAEGYKFSIEDGSGYWALMLWLPHSSLFDKHPLHTGLREWTRFATYSMEPFQRFSQPNPPKRGRAVMFVPYSEGRKLAWLRPRDTIAFERWGSVYRLTIKG